IADSGNVLCAGRIVPHPAGMKQPVIRPTSTGESLSFRATSSVVHIEPYAPGIGVPIAIGTSTRLICACTATAKRTHSSAKKAGALFNVEDFFQRIDIRIDEQAPVHLNSRVRSQVERFALVLLGARHLVSNAVLREKSLNQRSFLLTTSGEKPYGHPPLPYHARCFFGSIFGRRQTIGPFPIKVK